jgi:hypothetical protein
MLGTKREYVTSQIFRRVIHFSCWASLNLLICILTIFLTALIVLSVLIFCGTFCMEIILFIISASQIFTFIFARYFDPLVHPIPLSQFYSVACIKYSLIMCFKRELGRIV